MKASAVDKPHIAVNNLLERCIASSSESHTEGLGRDGSHEIYSEE
jgi:hypothetical protein